MNKIIDSIKNNKLVDKIKGIINNMILYLNKFIDKVGKVNFILLVVVIGAMAVIGLYTTLAADTSDNYSLIARTYKFIIGNKDGGEVIVAAEEGKFIDITVSNPEKIDMKYALYYSTTDTDFEIGYIKETVYPTSGVVKANSEVVISLFIKNTSTSNITIELGVDYGTINGGDISIGGTRIEEEIFPYDRLSEYVQNLYSDGSAINTVNIGADSSNPSVNLNSTQGIMLDNNGEYRYYGANPNNYVWFNDELWRIISVGNVKSSINDTEGETRVKMIKADILTDDNGLNAFSWDSSASGINSGYGVNDWSKSDLMYELNTLYYNGGSGNCYTGESNAITLCGFTNIGLNNEAKKLIGDAVYYLGASDVGYPSSAYSSERSSNIYEGNSELWTGRVGLIYPSDYMYATDLSICTSIGDYYDNTGCFDNDWLYSSYEQWTISSYLDDGYEAYIVNNSGYVMQISTSSVFAIRPVVYLSSDVIIVDGNGTSSNPYQLDLYEEGSYIATYDANGGTISDASSDYTVSSDSATAKISVSYGEKYGTLPSATRTGYTLAGWANFSTGEYIPLDYIESSGTQYINTGYWFRNENIRIYYDGTVLSNSGYQSLFGNEEYIDSSTRYFSGIPHGINGSLDIYLGSASQGTFNITLGTRFNLDISTTASKSVTVKKDGVAISGLDGITYTGSVITNSSNLTTGFGQIYIFANHNSTSSLTEPIQLIDAMRLYSFRLWDNYAMVRDMVPCYFNNTVGLYDTVNNYFYPSGSSDSFINGGLTSDSVITSNSVVSTPSNHTLTAVWVAN